MTSVLKVDSIQNSSGTSALTIDSSGNLTATQGFVTGTFTPTIFGATTAGVMSYNTSNTYGYYQRIGDIVHFTARVYVDSVTTDSTGNSRLGSLPFTASEASAVAIGKMNHAGTGWSGYGMFAQVEASADYIQFYFYSNPNQHSVATGLWADDTNNIVEVLVSGHYKI